MIKVNETRDCRIFTESLDEAEVRSEAAALLVQPRSDQETLKRGRAARSRCCRKVVPVRSPPCRGRRLAQPGPRLPRETSATHHHARGGCRPARGGRARPQCLSSLLAPCAAGTESGTSPATRVSLEERSGLGEFWRTDRCAQLHETGTWNRSIVKNVTGLEYC